MQANVVVEITDWEAAELHAKLIRETVFVREQGVPLELEMDGEDVACRHAIARTPDGTPVATGRLLPDGHIGRVAVLQEWRGKGLGREVMLALLVEARALGHAEVALNSQTSAVPFYLSLGFAPYGEGFMEAGIPHQAMMLRFA